MGRVGAREIAIGAIAGLAAACGVRADPSDRIDALVREEMARQRIPGVALAVVSRGEVVKAQGYGQANVEHAVPVSAETIFQSGSLGKQFTAALVMLLVEEGKLALDASVREYLHDAPESWQAIEIRHLLTHTSGVPEYTEGAIDLRRDYAEDELLRIAYRLPLEFAPGSRWRYSNTGYLLLGVIVHKASGSHYGELLRDRVFGPLRMPTARIISEADIVPGRAAGYRLVEGQLKNQEWVAPTLNTTADGSLYLSLQDWIAWDRGLRAGALLEPASWALVYEPVRLASGNRYPYGFGWEVEEIGGQRVIRHGGAWQGFETYVARYLGDDLTIVVLTNLAGAEPSRFVEAIAGLFDPALAPREPEAIPDREPEVTARLVALLQRAAHGDLSRDELAWVPAGFFPRVADEYRALLRDRGAPGRLELLERRQLGDDRVYRYALDYADAKLDVTLAIAPDDKVSELEISAR